MITKNELKRFRKKEQSCTSGASPYYDQYSSLLADYEKACEAMKRASDNRKTRQDALDEMDPEKHNVNLDDLVEGPWKDYVIFRADSLARIKELRNKMKAATKRTYYLMNKVNDPSTKDTTNYMKKLKDNVSQFSGWNKAILSLNEEIARKRREAMYSDAEYQRIYSVYLEDNATFSEKLGEVTKLNGQLEFIENKYRSEMKNLK